MPREGEIPQLIRFILVLLVTKIIGLLIDTYLAQLRLERLGNPLRARRRLTVSSDEESEDNAENPPPYFSND